MIGLTEITEENWLLFRSLSVLPEQSGFLDSALGILARGYVYRESRARVFGISEGETPVGLALVKDLDDEPACYDLQQFMIDGRYQRRGFGTEALKLIIALLSRERKYGCVEVCVKSEDAAAIRLYEKAGFADTGFIDEGAPGCVNMRLEF